MAGGTANDCTVVFVEVTLTSLFSPLLQIRFEFFGSEEKEIELGDLHNIVGVRDAVSVEVPDDDRVVYAPDGASSGKVTLTVEGGTQDTGWRNYPLMTTSGQIELELPSCDRVVAQFRLPEKLHILPNHTSLYVDGEEVTTMDGGWESYPAAQQTQHVRIQGRDEGTELRYVMTFRESAVAVLAPITFPVLLNLLVPLLAFTPADNAIKISVSIAVLPLYFRLWNWSNMMEIAPTFTNMITTEILLVSFFNVCFVLLWALPLGAHALWLFIGLAAAYLGLVAIYVHDSLRFIFDPGYEEHGITFSIQKAFQTLFNEGLGDSLKPPEG